MKNQTKILICLLLSFFILVVCFINKFAELAAIFSLVTILLTLVTATEKN